MKTGCIVEQSPFLYSFVIVARDRGDCSQLVGRLSNILMDQYSDSLFHCLLSIATPPPTPGASTCEVDNGGCPEDQICAVIDTDYLQCQIPPYGQYFSMINAVL